MIETAIEKRMEVFGLSEHMPRHNEDLYPEEIEMGLTYEKLEAIHRTFFKEAKWMRERYKSQIRIILGFETEWIRQSSLNLINLSLQSNSWDYFVGSVHHLHTKPIDFDRANYEAARDISGGSEERVFGDYFDAQFEMLQATKPPVVGHFDLIRLKSDNPEKSFQGWQPVWERILRNLKFVVLYGGLLEVNFSSLRKGLSEPYPKDEIAKVSRSSLDRASINLSHATAEFRFDGGQVLPLR
jgi:histidinol-phosphatase (PHP family)